MWTQFWDMHSGGGQKEKFAECYIEAPQAEAEVIFYNRFGHNPNRVTCTCCGNDYSISEEETLEQLTGYHRGCAAVYTLNGDEIEKWQSGAESKYVERAESKGLYPNKYVTLEEYVKDESVCVIYAKDILPGERNGELPEQGYVWMD